MVEGEATGFVQLIQLKSADGLHKAAPPPITFNVVELPTHIAGFAAVTAGGVGGPIEIVTAPVPLIQFPPEAVTE